jgi:hypothetical protein
MSLNFILTFTRSWCFKLEKRWYLLRATKSNKPKSTVDSNTRGILHMSGPDTHDLLQIKKETP